MDRGKGKAVNNNRRNRLRKLNRFVNRLYRVVNDPAVDDLISWNQDGSSFIVLRPHDFAQHLLPKYYYHNDLSKFLARLDIYGFTRVVPDGWEFANVCFKRGEKKLLGSIQPQNCTKIEMESDACSVTCRAKDEEDCSDVDDSMATESQPGGVTTVRDMEETASTIPQDEGPYLEFLGKKFSCPASPSSSQNFGSPTQTSILRELSTTDQLSTNTNHHPSSRGYISPIVEHDFWSKEATTSNYTFNYSANFGSGLGGKDDKFSYSGSRCSDPNTRSPTPTTISGESSITCQVSTHTKHQPRFRVYIPPILQHDHEGSLLSKNKELDVVITEKATTSNATFSCLANSGLGLGGRDDTQTSVSERTVDPIALALDIGLRPNSNLNSNPNPPFRPPALLSQGQDVVVQESSLWGHSDGLIIGDALAYCSLYPPHHEFNRDTLVHLWIAAGFVLRDPMEDFATLFFEDCVSYGYFEFSRTDSVTRNPLYKFKRDSDLVGLLFRSRENDIFRIEGEFNQSDLSHVSHLSIACDTIKHTPIFLICKRFEQLRTLIFLGCKSRFKQIPHDFFQSLELLKVLDLSHSSLLELPTSVGNLKFLCFLDLSDTPIKYLPETIGNLKHLQTLKLRGCQSISALPRCMRKLVNLRHLDFDVFGRLDSMPPGMGALTNIRTLSAFLVGTDDECNIMQLKNMNNLSGSFFVSGLECVLTKEEAEEACLSKKSHLKKLDLHWSDSLDDSLSSQMILSSLRPNTSLEDLHITCYDGPEFPNWISDPSFSKLGSITLVECENCVALPSLGQLPSLKFLHIGEFHKLSVIDHYFYGDQGITSDVAFPNLEKLLVEDMSDLEVWADIKKYYFPRLVKLTIKGCPKLHSFCSLSNFHSLENLEIIHCPELDCCFNENLPGNVKIFIIECPMIKARLLKDKGQDWFTVAHIAHLWIDHQKFPFGERAQQAHD